MQGIKLMYDPQNEVRDRLHRESAFDRKYEEKCGEVTSNVMVFIYGFLLFIIPFPIAATIYKTTGLGYLYSHALAMAVIYFGFKAVKKLLKNIYGK